MALQVFLFGTPRCEVEGETVTSGRRKVMALLAYLALTDRPHSRDLLATLLWPEYDDSGARANLRRDLSRLKRMVGDDYLIITRSQAGFDPQADIWVDVVEFKERLETVAAHEHGNQPFCATCADSLARAIALYQDDFLAGFSLSESAAFDDWQFFEREGLRQLLASALQQLASWHIARAEFEQAIAHARHWLSLDPLHEPAHRLLMRLYAWNEQHAAALRQYDECERILEEELGVSPEPDSLELYQIIRARRLEPPTVVEAPLPLEAVQELPEANRYLLGEQIAAGSQGDLYQGEDRLTGEVVIIKRLRADVAGNAEKVARFLREGKVLQQLEHPNIVRMLAAFEQDNHYTIVLEHVSGGTLRDLLEKEAPLPLQQALPLALELADALSRAHHVGVLHRDLKPENVFIAADGSPRLGDFGMAWLEQDPAHLTATGAFVGTPAYTSPEALRGEPLDASRDVWSFGVLLYEMLTGRLPFAGDTLVELITSILNKPAPSLAEERPDLPPVLDTLLQQMLCKDPSSRLSSMRQVAAVLDALHAGKSLEEIYGPLLPAPAGAAQVAARPEQQEAAASPSPLTQAPADLRTTEFVGREKEVARVEEMLADPNFRLLTILGPGGIGKTSLATEIADKSAARFRDGVLVVPLAPLSTPDELVGAVAERLHLHFYEETETLEQQLIEALRHKEMLLFLDNFEHLLPAASFVARMLQAAPKVKILVTSRERLGLSGEAIYILEGMSFPASELPATVEVSHYGALQLLVQRASLVRPGFQLHGAELEHAIRICRLVQGMPLALVLAAGWLELLSLQEIADEIAQNLDFLETEMRDIPDRQRSMRAVFRGSWEMLDPPTQQALARLSVFRGPFSREAAQAVGDTSLRTLLSLVHKSWLQRTPDGDFQIHELLRQYAAELLQRQSSAWQEAREKHAAYYATFLALEGEVMKGPGQQQAFQGVHNAFDNIRAAWRWTIARGDLETLVERMLPAVYRYCEARLRGHELRRLVDDALEALPSSAGRLRAALFTARGAFYRHGYPVRFETFGMVLSADEEAIRTAWSLLPTAEELRALGFWGIVLAYLYGRVIEREQAIYRMRQLVAYFKRQGASWEEAFALQHLVQLLHLDLPEAEQVEQLISEALAIFEGLGDARESAFTLRARGQAYRLEDRLSEAIREWQAAQRKLETVGEWAVAADMSWQLGDALLQLGEFEGAFDHYRKMSERYAAIGNQERVGRTLSKLSYELVRYGDLDEARTVREKALSLAYEVDDDYGIAWSTWELGELLRVQGDLEAARRWFDRSHPLFQRVNEQIGLAFYYRANASLALAQANFLEARNLLHRSLRYARATGHDWGLAYTLAELARVEVRIGHYERAQEYLAEALARAQVAGDRGMALLVLAAVTDLYAVLEENERAVQLGAFVLEHRLTWREIREQVQAQLAKVELPVLARQAAQEQGRRLLQNKRAIWKVLADLQQALCDPYLMRPGKSRFYLPIPSARLIDRDQEMSDVVRLLMAEPDCRLLTLLGPPGIGKTRLALQAAAVARRAMPDGAIFLSLAQPADDQHLLGALLLKLDLPLAGTEAPRSRLLDTLRQKELMLVLDNFPVSPATTALLAEIVQAAPAVTMLLTSSQLVELAGEVGYSLGSLPFPEPNADLETMSYAALDLLLQRIEQIRPDFELVPDDKEHLARLAHLAQGVPLALLLAAGGLTSLSAADLAAALDAIDPPGRDRPPAAHGGVTPVATRDPVRPFFDLLWRELSPSEKECFLKLSVFEGGFTRRAAQRVAGASLHVLRALANRSLLEITRGGRYEIHDVLRQYGAQMLVERGLEDNMRAAHGNYYLQALTALENAAGEITQAQLAAARFDLENVRRAREWALDAQQESLPTRILQMLLL